MAAVPNTESTHIKCILLDQHEICSHPFISFIPLLSTGSSGVSPANSIPAINEILVSDENNGIMEISFHVPNLREAKLGSR